MLAVSALAPSSGVASFFFSAESEYHRAVRFLAGCWRILGWTKEVDRSEGDINLAEEKCVEELTAREAFWDNRCILECVEGGRRSGGSVMCCRIEKFR